MDHERQRHDGCRQKAGGEERRDRGVGDAAVDDHRQARRHQDAHPGRGGDDRAGVAAAVALALHRRDHHRADGGRIGIGRSGDAGEEDHRDDHDVAEAAAAVTDEHARERHQPLRDAAGLHQLSGENEERNGEEREIVDAGEDAARHDPQRRAFVDRKTGDGRAAEREGDRNAGQHEHHEQDGRGRHCGGSCTSRIWPVGRRIRWTAR